MIDYQGFRNYLERLGFASNGINTYISSYLHENKIAILNNLDEYSSLDDEDKIIKLSKEDKSFKEQFDMYHSFSRDSTFSDVTSGARRYVYFLQYKAILSTIERYKENKEDFLNNEPYWFFSIFNEDDIYPIKAICRENLEILDLDINFHTDNGKKVLNDIFNFKNNSKNLVFVNTKEENNSSKQDIVMTNNFKKPLNQILYGPPGTGKTYNTIDKALQIIDGEVPNDREKAKARFEELKEVGQIEFVTFHQSYGYEEFVEGIKATTSEKGIEYNIESGVLKRLTEEALSKDEIDTTISSLNGNEIIWKMSLGDSSNGEDTIYYEEAKNTDSIIMGYGNNIDFTNCKNKNDIEKLTRDDSVINAIDRFKNQLKNNDIVIISDGNRKFKAIVRVVEDYLFDNESDLKQKRKIEWLQRFEKSRDVKEISDRYFTQATLNKPQGIIKDKLLEFLTNKEIVDNTKKNYLLIIDEINRGNISKIFGELITLIEESKRLGEKEEMKVTLPYSGEKFGVPKNLYIIGTMNTADRSIALMDTALRRRFEFEEMMPNPYLLINKEETEDLLDNDNPEEDITNIENWSFDKGQSKLFFYENHNSDLMIGDINLRRLLYKINQRIEYLYDRDHTIGHAYFLRVKDKISLDSIMRNKVIPLLQEYFYDDWEKIQIVLGDYKEQGKEEHDKFVRSVQNNEKDILGFSYDELDEEEYSYSINETFTEEAYLKIYE